MFGILGHTLRGCVDWNRNGQRYCYYGKSHTLRGCVDWNTYNLTFVVFAIVTPCVGVWIETIMHPRQTGQGIVTPCVGVWIETYSEHIANVQKGHTLRGCVDWNNDEVNTCIDNHSHTLRGCIWIEALFTRWSSLWKNCKHSASCVFLFKLL